MYHEQQEGGVRRKKRHGKMVHCPYNITHHVPNSVLKKHIEMCEDFYKYCTDLQKDPPCETFISTKQLCLMHALLTLTTGRMYHAMQNAGTKWNVPDKKVRLNLLSYFSYDVRPGAGHLR